MSGTSGGALRSLNTPLLGLAAYSGTGKTTLLSSLIPLLNDADVQVGVIKHSHHDFEIDRPGKDSHKLRAAGARQLIVASPYRTVLIDERTPAREPNLSELVARFDAPDLDLILVEGFRNERFPKIELHRREFEKPFLFPHDDSIIAVASDEPLSIALPVLDLNRPRHVCDFVLNLLSRKSTGALL